MDTRENHFIPLKKKKILLTKQDLARALNNDDKYTSAREL
jgi:hypothetical protein